MSSSAIQRQIKQERPFRSIEEEVFVGLQIVSDRLMAPWAAHLKQVADLTHVQYNVLRILRGAGPNGLSAGEVGERLIIFVDLSKVLSTQEQSELQPLRQAQGEVVAI